MSETRSKSSNRQGIKQSSLESSSASQSTGKSGPICWNCGEVGHRRCNCPNPPYCSKCKQKGHLPVKCPLKGKRNETSQMPQKVQQTSVDQRFSSIRNKCIHCGDDHTPGSCPMKMQPQATPNAAGCQTYNNSTSAGKVNNNVSLSFSSKNCQRAAASMTPSSPVINSSGVQGRSSCAQEPWITLRLVPVLHSKILITCHQCIHQIISHHLLIFQSHFHHHLLHPLMCLMHIQLLCQIFQPRSPL